MDVHALTDSSLFQVSLGLCALVAAFGITLALKTFFHKIFTMAAFAGFSAAELESIECATKFQNEMSIILEKVLGLEDFSAEAPPLFNDSSWSRLLRLCDDLEIARGELNELLTKRDFESARLLGRFLCGLDTTVPTFPRDETAIELRTLTFWRRDTIDLLHRMVSKLSDYSENQLDEATPTKQLSAEFLETIEEIKTFIEDNNVVRVAR